MFKCHKINPNRGGSYIDSHDWIKNKKATINPINGDDKCFQYAATVALNHEEIGRILQGISGIKPFIKKFNLKRIHFPSGKDDRKKTEKNNLTIALILMFCMLETRKHILPISKQNSKREKQDILLMIISMLQLCPFFRTKKKLESY